MPLTTVDFSGAISLLRTNKGVQLEIHTAEPVLHNGQPAQNGQMLVLGDGLQLGQSALTLQLIVVEQVT
jgi:hypothetical protein